MSVRGFFVLQSQHLFLGRVYVLMAHRMKQFFVDSL